MGWNKTTTVICGIGAAMMLSVPALAQAPAQDRVSATEKGSLLIFSKVEIRWDAMGNLIQDTFVDLSNDYPDDVNVLMYFINGDPPLAQVGEPDDEDFEREHPGWNWVDVEINLTKNEPTYWSALTGQPKGVSPFTILDPGDPPGRPAPDGTGDRVMRGYIIAWAVNKLEGHQIRWNHLKGDVTIVNYLDSTAWEYNAYAYQAGGVHGEAVGEVGVINMDGLEYSRNFDLLLMDFYAVGSPAFSGPQDMITIGTDLTLHPVPADLRQETDGPVTTKANFDIWNMNETKFSETHRCITCWDQTLLADYGIPNNFLLGNLQTNKGKARIDGLASGVFCDDPNATPPVISEAAPLLGVVAKHLDFNMGSSYAAAGTNLIGMGTDDTATIQFDAQDAPPEANEDPVERALRDPLGFLDDMINEADRNQSEQ